MNAQLASDLVLGFIGLLSALGILGVALSFYHLGRQNYRKH